MSPHRPPVPVTHGSPAFRSIATDDFRVTDAAFAPGLILPRHAHEHAILSVIVRGGYDLGIDGQHLDCDAGVCLVEPSGMAHVNRVGTDGSRNLILEVQPDATGEWCGPVDPFRDGPRTLRHPRFTLLAHQLLRELLAPDAVSPMATQALGLELLTAVVRGSIDHQPGKPLPRWLKRVREQLDATIESPVTLAQLAREAGVHRARLSRSFRVHFGCAVGEYHRRVRIRWAAGAIARQTMTLAEIAARSGFADQSHFCRVFRTYMGVTPSQYGEAHGGAR